MDNHQTLTTFSRIKSALGDDMRQRGYDLTQTDDGFAISGDEGQFYCDAVAADIHAHLVMEFLRLTSPAEYDAFRSDATNDLIDLDESQAMLLMGKPLEAHLDQIEARAA